MSDIIIWFQQNWLALGVALWALEEAIGLISKLTPWKWDDNFGSIIGSIISKIFPKQ